MAEILVLGAGGMGVSLAVMAQKAGHRVTVWTPFEEEADLLRRTREHKKLLQGVKIPEEIDFVTRIPGRMDLAIVATPSFAVRETSRQLAAAAPARVPVACVSKGLEQGTLKDMAQVMGEELTQNPVVILSGPSHAEEIARGVPTTVVAASENRKAAEAVQDILMNSRFRIYVNDDVLGVELGGALKNVIALAVGALDGMQLGDNAKAALMTRGITEIARLGVAMGAKSETFAGLSGVGDMIVTCTSQHSRNRRAGTYIGQGHTPEEAVRMVGMTVEGYTSTKCAYELARQRGVEMPIISETYRVLYEGKNIQDAIRDLMERPKRHESEVIWLLSRQQGE